MSRINTTANHALTSVLAFAFLGVPSAWATCYKVEKSVTTDSPSNTQIRSVDGQAAKWEGAIDSNSGPVGLPNVVTLLDPELQSYPTLLASSVVPLTTYGQSGGFDPEQVLIRCAPNDPVIEQYATNADDFWSGSGVLPMGDFWGMTYGLAGAMRTRWANVLLKLTNVTTGDVLSHIWKGRELSGLDIEKPGRKDGQQYKLVKAKNLSTIKLELFSAAAEPLVLYGAAWSDNASKLYEYNEPAGYISLAGPGFQKDMRGYSGVIHQAGYPASWPGNISLYNKVTLKRSPTCAVTTVTPVVQFPAVTVNQLNSGENQTVPFQIQFKCQSSATSGVAQNSTAIGFKVSAGSLAASGALGLVNGFGGLSHLVSDHYGQPGMAQGVGIRILRRNEPVFLLANEDSALGSNANSKGWYGILEGDQQKINTTPGIDHYTEAFTARLEKLINAPLATPGKVEATVQVIIRVQ